MIPLRVELENFLSYRQKVVFDFSDRALWMLSGPNGSGKSSVFDAISYALYGQHRLGGQNADELIHGSEDRFKVALEFEADGTVYRVERTKERKSAKTTQVLRELRDGKLVVPPGMDKSDRVGPMEALLRTKIVGLSFEAFTSSVLLLQGRVDKLVAPAVAGERSKVLKERYLVLSEALDISVYQRLSERARTKKIQAKRTADDTLDRLNDQPEVADAEIAAAQEQATGAATLAEKAQKRSAALGVLLPQAKAWEEANAQIAAIQGQIADANALLADAETIRNDAARHVELVAILPRLRGLRDATERLAAAATTMQEAEATAEDVARTVAYMVGLPADTDAETLETTLENALADAEEAGRILSPLGQFVRCRTEARKAATRLESLTVTVPSDPGDTESACEAEADALHHAQEALGDARVAYDIAQKATQEASERLQRFQDAGEEANCRFCGQILTAEKRTRMFADFEASITTCVQDEETAKEIGKRARAAFQAADEALNDAESRYKAARLAFDNCRRDIAAQENAFQKAAEDALYCAESLPVAVTAKMPLPNGADDEWLSPDSFPTESDLREMQGRANALATLRQRRQTWNAARQAEQQNALLLETRHDERERAAFALPDDWREQAGAFDTSQLNSFLAGLLNEQGRLAAAPENLRRLDDAERRRDVLEGQRKIAEGQRARVPENARQPVAALEGNKAKADADHAAAQKEAKSAGDVVIRLHERRKNRNEEQIRYAAQKRTADLYAELERMLGKDGLQRFLLFEAEQVIVEAANDALKDFSQGTLVLEQRPDADAGGEKALDLLCRNSDISIKPLPLEGLSGGQKFRVAVALALGIGQYARRNNARIQSLIIDEGFGSLDATGLADMADALRDLSVHLKSIIVVSHQEAFAANFPDRYEISLTGGASQALRSAVV